MSNQWFKFYGGEYLSDQKMGNLTAQERSCLITLLCMASVSSVQGEIEFLTTEILLEKSGVHFDPYDTSEWDNCLAVLDKFERLKIIKKVDGIITVLNWEKRQDRVLTNAERQAKYRENHKNNEKVTKPITKVTLEENRIEENRREEKNTMSVTTDTFNKFWNKYPKKELKKKTQEIWNRKKLDSKLEEILLFIEKAKETDRWKKGFVKQPPVFLNGECWNDDLNSYKDNYYSRGKSVKIIQ